MPTAAVIGGGALLGAGANAWSNKKASEAAERESRKARQATEAGADEAIGAVNALFPGAQASAQQGYQNALDILSGAMPLQTQAFQQGNVGAQEAILAGLPQIQNAILGRPVDFSQMQPRTVNFDAASFLAGVPNLQAQAAQRITPTLNVNPSAPSFQSAQQIGMSLPWMLLNNPQYLNAARGLVK